MFDHILILTDGSDHTVRAADYAIGLAATYRAALHALYVVDVQTGHTDVPIDDDDSQTRGETAVDVVVDRVAGRNAPIGAEVRVDLPHETITSYGDECDIDLMVTDAHGTSGLERYLLGDVVGRVIRLSGVPVLCMPPADDDERRM